MNEMFGGNQRTEINCIKNENGDITHDMEEVVNIFNNNYINMGKKLADGIKRTSNYEFDQNINEHSIFLYPATTQETMGIIRELKNRKSPGIDDLKSETLKLVAEYISEPITYIFNQAIEYGHFPACLKISVVTPIFKGGSRENTVNYRPVSLITNLSKILEKLIKVRLTSFLTKYKILNESQFGFQEGKSTQNAIVELTDYIYGTLDKSKLSMGVFIDLSKAFDTVNHSILLKTLENTGIRGNAYKLLKSYLKNRQQMVRIKNTKSCKRTITCGVPQGTVLGPILFCIYINELFSIGATGKIISFADDTAVIYSGESWLDIKENSEKDLEFIKDWFDYKQLSLNFQKTYFVPFCNYKSSLPHFQNIKIGNNAKISSATQIKYLGVIIDSHFRWNSHINYIVRKLRIILYKFRMLKDRLNLKEKKYIYHSLVQSHLSYCIIGWGGALKTHLRSLEVIQRKFLRLILNKPFRYSSNKLYEESGIFDLRQLFFKTLVLTQYKEKSKLNKPSHEYITRTKTRYVIPKKMKNVGQRSYSFLGPTAFNFLPDIIKTSRSFAQLKKLVNLFITSLPRKNICEIIDRRI